MEPAATEQTFYQSAPTEGGRAGSYCRAGAQPRGGLLYGLWHPVARAGNLAAMDQCFRLSASAPRLRRLPGRIQNPRLHQGNLRRPDQPEPRRGRVRPVPSFDDQARVGRFRGSAHLPYPFGSCADHAVHTATTGRRHHQACRVRRIPARLTGDETGRVSPLAWENLARPDGSSLSS